jgi:putative integral membrane protein (TIGR02587 family)
VREVNDALRGLAGGMLFGIPLLYTMEVWWIGSHAEPVQMLAVLMLSFVPVYLLNRTGGFRRTSRISGIDAAKDSVEALALGIVAAAVVLVLLREITFASSLSAALGKIVYEAVPFSLGVALAGQFLRGARDEGDEREHGRGEGAVDPTVADLGATAVGALFVSLSIAPTDEVPMIAAAMEPLWLVLVVAASLLVTYGIVFQAGFGDAEKRRRQQGALQRPVTETIASYLVALVVAAVLLWFFGHLDLASGGRFALARVVVLGLPAAVGGAAGRLAV